MVYCLKQIIALFTMQIPSKTLPTILNTNSQKSSDNKEDESKRTVFCKNLSDQVTEELLFELFLQTGPLESVKIPKDKNGHNRTFGFVIFAQSISVAYALKLLAGVKLFNRELKIQCGREKGNNNVNQNHNQSNIPQRQPFMRFGVGDVENDRGRQSVVCSQNNNDKTLRFKSAPLHSSGIDMNIRSREGTENERNKSNSVDSHFSECIRVTEMPPVVVAQFQKAVPKLPQKPLKEVDKTIPVEEIEEYFNFSIEQKNKFNTSVFVSHLSNNINEFDLQKFCLNCGKILNVEKINKFQSIIKFKNNVSALKAIQLNHKFLKGKKIRIKFLDKNKKHKKNAKIKKCKGKARTK